MTKITLMPVANAIAGTDLFEVVQDTNRKATITQLITHLDGRYYTETEVDALIANFSSVGHTHAEADVTGLTAALAGKAASVHSHAQADVTNLVADLAGKAAASHTHAQADVTNLVTDLAGKAALSHAHGIGDITGFDEAVDDRVGALLVQGSNVTLTYNDGANTLTIASTGGAASISHLCSFFPFSNEPPAADYATIDMRNGHPVLDFDTTTAEAAIFTGILPEHYTGGGITVEVHWMTTSAITGTGGWTVEFERISDSTLDLDADSFATAQTITAVTVPGTTGIVMVSSVAVSDGAPMDSIAAGNSFRIRVKRDVANDNAAGDLELVCVNLLET